MLYRRPVFAGTLKLTAAALLGVASGALFLEGVFTAFERPLTAWYHANNH